MLWAEIGGKQVGLLVDLGGHFWILGLVGGGVLRMFMVKLTAPGAFSVIAEREDAKYKPA